MRASELRPGERIKNVRWAEDTMSVDLLDGRTIVVPLAWYPRLLDASPEQRRNWRLSGAGFGIHWPGSPQTWVLAAISRRRSRAR